MSLLCDFHVHSNYSDGVHSIDELIEIYGRRNFDVIAITDHIVDNSTLLGRFAHGLGRSIKAATLDQYFSHLRQAAKTAWQRYNLLVIPGYEITKNSFNSHRAGHYLVLGEVEPLDARHEITQALSYYRQRGAITVAAHPLSTGRFEFQTKELWDRRAELAPYFDAWEVNCGRKFYSEVLHSQLPILASSDLHDVKQIHCWKTELDSTKDLPSVFAAIREQHLSVVDYREKVHADCFLKVKSMFSAKCRYRQSINA